MSFEIRIQHEGLNAYRVVRGATPKDAELKAKAQIAVWNERWATRKAREAKAREVLAVENKKAAAARRTEELQEQIAALSEILKAGLSAPAFQWEQLKDKTPFTAPRPTCPQNAAYPAEPNPAYYAPVITRLDRFIKRRRARKEAEAASELEAALNRWRLGCAATDEKNQATEAEYQKKLAVWLEQKEHHRSTQLKQHSDIDQLESQYRAADASALEFFCLEALSQSSYPQTFPQDYNMNFDPAGGVLVLDYEFPNKAALPHLKEVKYIATRDQVHEVAVSDAWLNRTYEEVLYQITLRSLHELFAADKASILKSIVFNGWVHSVDRATGAETHGCILSVQTSREEFSQINLAQVDPKACFRKLKGVASSKLAELTPVRPIALLNKEDHRFVEAYSVVEGIDTRTNLAAVDWMDFENLIRELFEKEFSKNGGEVKITQASRDGGVDAIAFDPDPIRGGKIVIQAKRYTNVVGVSAVRDLYGTVHNEGANKGILVTTATYGPDAYEFAKGKPLTLLSGSELLSLLEQHGHKAKIDLKEAKAASSAGLLPSRD